MRLGSSGWARRAVGLGLAAALTLVPTPAQGAGPRWSAGRTYFQAPNGQPVLWNTPRIQYYTDPGDLSAAVSHAAADQIVAAAASMWNVSIASIVLGQGGTLNQHVSGANVYLGSSGPVFPSDVQVTNGAAKPIAVLYDTDGSVTDTLLGGGASDPGNCRQNAVTESVDGISPAAQITHALLILNGRCTGTAPELQMEMQYKLERAFGRILGFGWSQANDNVWTGNPVATYQQALHWPLMHPVDIFCGPYAYQCVVQPFTLKTDDLASIASLYPVTAPGNGKTATFAEATYITGAVNFANGQGMQGVNVVSRTRHQRTNATDTWDGTSSVTGYQFQQAGGNPVTPKGNSLAASFGSPYANSGYYKLGWIPAPAIDLWDDITVYTQPINPLYTGQYAVGPYQNAQVVPSGPPLSSRADFIGAFNTWNLSMTATNGAGPCSTAGDGTEQAPVAVDSTGWWSSTMCGYGHTAWSTLAVKAQRSLAVEVTSLDDAGLPGTGKLQPVLGLWNRTDAVGTAPTLGSQTDSLNTTTLGMTSLLFASGSSAQNLRMGLGDVRGDGRPDFAYKARVLYADSVVPVTLPANGGQITISGMGFRNGNAVMVNGVAAAVVSWSATTIVAVAPALSGSGAMDVTVTDLSTGSQTTMAGVLRYSGTALPDTLTIVSAPADGAYVGVVAAPDFKVRVTLPDGVTPAVGARVTMTAANATLGACAGAPTCVLTSDQNGQVTSTVIPLAAGTVTLTAAVGQASVTATFVTGNVTADVLRVTTLPGGTVYAGIPAATPFGVQVMLGDGVTAAAGATVKVSAVNATLAACGGTSRCTVTADGTGAISTAVTPLAAGAVSLLAAASGGTVSASFGAVAQPADVLRVLSSPANGAYAGRVASLPFSVRVLLGDATTSASGTSVQISAAGALLGACAGAASCVLSADGTGVVTTTVTPVVAGTVMLSAVAGGGSVTAAFTALPAAVDTLQAISLPANGSYVGRTAALPFTVQAMVAGTGVPAAGMSVTLTTSNGTLGACGSVACVLTANAAGQVSTSVTPGFAGPVTLTGAEGGGMVSILFNAVPVPADVVQVVSVPADGSVVGQPSTAPFSVMVLLGDTGAPAAGVGVIVRASNGTMGCGMTSCRLTTDANGMASAAVTPINPGQVALTALEGGGSATASFNAVAASGDTLRLISKPADGSLVGQPAAIPFTVRIFVGNTGIAYRYAIVWIYATNATFGACGRTACRVQADGSGNLSIVVTPTAPGLIALSMTEGGGAVSTSFMASSGSADRLQVISQPSGSVYATLPAATPFRVQVMLPGGTTPAAGVAVTLTAINAGLAACAGAATCVLTADGSGTVSTGVTPPAAGLVTLRAAAGGGSVAASFSALGLPPDSLHVLSAPADGASVSQIAGTPFKVQAMLGDGVTPAAGLPLTLSSAGASFGGCPASPCLLTTDSVGTISTTVRPNILGPVTITASGGGGTVSTTFTAGLPGPDLLHVLSAPGSGAYVSEPALSPFKVQVLLPDGVTPAAWVAVTLNASGASLGVCGSPGCVVSADASGVLSTSVTPLAAGVVGLTATAGAGSLSVHFQAVLRPPDSLRVVSSPGDGALVGEIAAVPLVVQVMLPDGVTPASGLTVTVTAQGAVLGACGGAVCTLIADAQGQARTTVTPQAPGTVTVTAAAGGGTVSTTFSAVAQPDVLRVLSVPAGTVYAGYVAATRFTVQVMLADGVTPAAGASVSVAAAQATLSGCGTGCQVTADARGMVSADVTPTAAGAVTLQATAGGGTVSSTFLAVDALHGLTLDRTVEYVAPGVSVAWAPAAWVFDHGTPATGATVAWTVDPPGGIIFTVTSTTTDGQGSTTNGSTLGPLAAGVTATGSACVWTSVCAPLSAVAVDPARWRIVVVSGAGQDVAVASTLLPVQARVVDDAGHWIAGAVVSVHQVVDGWVDCPPAGRCPIPPVLAESTANATTDVDGLITATPQEVPGVRAATRMVFAAGPNGYAALTLAKSH